MKRHHLYLAVAIAGILGVAKAAAGPQSPSLVSSIPATHAGSNHHPVPVGLLEYFPVINYVGRASGPDVVFVGPGERLVLLGLNASAVGLGGLSRASAFRLPVVDAPFAENLLSQAYVQAGVPLLVLDEGSYVFAEYPGMEDVTPRREHSRALVGYRVRAGT